MVAGMEPLASQEFMSLIVGNLEQLIAEIE